MFNAGLQVLAPQRTDQSLLSRMRGLASASIGEYLLGLLFVMFIAGNIVWFFDRQHRYPRGVGRGMFRAAAVSLVGEMGEPSHLVSEVARVVWAVVGICFVSAFTASLTTELTVQQITGSIHGVSDLVDKRVVTFRGSTAGQYLTDRRIDFEAADTAEDAFARLEAGNVDAMVLMRRCFNTMCRPLAQTAWHSSGTSSSAKTTESHFPQAALTGRRPTPPFWRCAPTATTTGSTSTTLARRASRPPSNDPA